MSSGPGGPMITAGTTSLHQMIAAAADHRPDAPAARCDGATLSYEMLARRAHGLARVLRAAGLERGDRVAVLLGKGLTVPVSFYGVLAAGGTLVPIDPRSPHEQVVRVVGATGARHLVTEPSRAGAVREVLAASPDVAHVVGLELDDKVDREVVPWSTVDEEACDEPPRVATTDLDGAYILHTSGSTGVPKLIRHTHRSAMSFVEWAVSEYGLRPEDRLSNHSSHHTCFATFDYYAAARAGASTVILTPATLMLPASLSAQLESERVSIWYSVPTALVHLSLRGDLEARDLSAMRWVVFAGESFPLKHLRRIMAQLPDARFSHVYGSTEVNVCTYYHLPEPDDLAADLPIGKPCPTAGTLVVDGALRPVPPGETGELLVRGSTVMSSYWGDPDATRRALLRLPSDDDSEDVYFRTGDRVRLCRDGNLAFVARADFQVKVRGHRVELGEIETALLALPWVQEAAAFTVADGEGSSDLRAAVVGGGITRPTPEDLRGGLEGLLPPHAIPSEISILDSLPRTPTGKIDRGALQAGGAQ